jgi:hypothetical protein
MTDSGADVREPPMEAADNEPAVGAKAREYVKALLAPDVGGVLGKLRPGQVVAFRGPSGASYRYRVGSAESSLLATPAQQSALLEEDQTAMRSNLITAAAQLVMRTRYPGLGI